MSTSYIVSNHKSTAVNNCVAGSFTGPNDLNLILAKSSILEIYLVTPEGLKLLKEFPINGKIVSLQLFRSITNASAKRSHSQNSSSDTQKEFLFLLTHKYNVCILECNRDQNDVIQISTKAYGNVQEKIGRPSETGMIASIDPEGRVIGLRLYDGLYKIIKLDDQNFLHQDDKSAFEFNSKHEIKAFNVNIEERKIIDITFLDGFEVPMLALINQDSEGRHFRTYKLSDRDLIHGPWNENNIEAEASILIPVPALLGGGVVIVGQESIMYYRDNSPFAIRPPVMKQNSITCYCRIDPNGSRYLLGDMGGRLFMLLLEATSSGPAGPFIIKDMRLEALGETCIPECLTYLDNGVIYVGSRLGDSQLIRLRTNPIQVSSNQNSVTMASYIEVLESFTNLGPIVDMIVVDAERSGHKDQLVTCSGAFKDGSLRVLRDGIGVTQTACLDLPCGIRGLWTLKNAVTGADSHLVLAFASSDLSTRVISFESSGGAEEIELPGLVTRDAVTLWCGNVSNNNMLQVTTRAGRLIDRIKGRVAAEWFVPGLGMEIDQNNEDNMPDTSTTSDHVSITVAACNGIQLCLASGRDLFYLEIGKNDLILKSRKTFPHEIACLDISPLPRSTETHDEVDSSSLSPNASKFCAAGFWTEVAVEILYLPSLDMAHREVLPRTDIIPRSLIMCHFRDEEESTGSVAKQREVNKEGSMNDENSMGEENGNHCCYLLVALGDGTLYHYSLSPLRGRMSQRKKFIVGTRPPSLKLIPSASPLPAHNVLVCSDRPAVVYMRNKKLVVSDVNLEEISYACPFDSPAYPDSLVLVPSATSGTVVIATIDEIRKLHIRTIPLYESPRRIAYQESSHTFALLTARIDVYNGTSFVPHQPQSVSCKALNHSSSSSFSSSSTTATGAFNSHKQGGGGHIAEVGSSGAPGSSSTQSNLNNYNTNGSTPSPSFGDESEAYSLVILDAHTFEPFWAHHFQPNEFATSIISFPLAGSNNTLDLETQNGNRSYSRNVDGESAAKELYIVGTAMVYPDEPEPRQGKIMVFEFSKTTAADENAQNNLLQNNEDSTGQNADSYRRLTLISEKEISGAPYSMAYFSSSPLSGSASFPSQSPSLPSPPTNNKLIACVNSTVRLFEWVPADRELRLECSHFNNVLALHLKTHFNTLVLVGDLMRSLTLLEYRAAEGRFEESARDFEAAWTSAIEIIDAETFLAAENSYNLYVCRVGDEGGRLGVVNGADLGNKKKDGTEGAGVTTEGSSGNKPKSRRDKRSNLNANTTSSSNSANIGGTGSVHRDPHNINAKNPNSCPSTLLDDERKHLYPVGLYHLGEFVNVFKRGCLVSRNTGDSALEIGNPILMGTISGSVHLMVQLPPRIFTLLDRLQIAMGKHLPTLGKISHQNFRAFHTEQKTEPSRGFIDGDLVETFLDLNVEDRTAIMNQVAPDVKDEGNGDAEIENKKDENALITSEEIIKIIEELVRLH
ncbi:unnamed protein product [Gordionus sp. m RMFG-2023]|uniref:DNA damage-binding protein 1-like isoform X2 n=1 Tax=Gordionus sp. m RMFG-2023 TaxID=3053472 RepID=UPI0030DFB9EE